jgi:hypothetical protein
VVESARAKAATSDAKRVLAMGGNLLRGKKIRQGNETTPSALPRR